MCVIGVLAERDVPLDEAPSPYVVVAVDVPRFGQLVADAYPRLGIVEQVIALGEDDARRWLHGHRAGQRLFQRPLERGRIHGVLVLTVEPPKQREVAVAVERVDRTLAVTSAKPVQFDVGEMKSIHRDARRDYPTLIEYRRQR